MSKKKFLQAIQLAHQMARLNAYLETEKKNEHGKKRINIEKCPDCCS